MNGFHFYFEKLKLLGKSILFEKLNALDKLDLDWYIWVL